MTTNTDRDTHLLQYLIDAPDIADNIKSDAQQLLLVLHASQIGRAHV